MEAAIVAHDTSKQEDAIRMNQQHVNQCVKEYSYSYTEFKCIIIDACEDVTTYSVIYLPAARWKMSNIFSPAAGCPFGDDLLIQPNQCVQAFSF